MTEKIGTRYIRRSSYLGIEGSVEYLEEEVILIRTSQREQYSPYRMNRYYIFRRLSYDVNDSPNISYYECPQEDFPAQSNSNPQPWNPVIFVTYEPMNEPTSESTPVIGKKYLRVEYTMKADGTTEAKQYVVKCIELKEERKMRGVVGWNHRGPAYRFRGNTKRFYCRPEDFPVFNNPNPGAVNGRIILTVYAEHKPEP